MNRKWNKKKTIFWNGIEKKWFDTVFKSNSLKMFLILISRFGFCNKRLIISMFCLYTAMNMGVLFKHV